jgi:hypothetical protein
MNIEAMKRELAFAIGEMYRAEHAGFPGTVHEYLCIVEDLCADLPTDSPEERKAFTETIDEAEISGS